MKAIVRARPTDTGGEAWFYGPQGKRYQVIGTTADGDRLGVAEVSPQELAIIASPVHRDQYITDSWRTLFASRYGDDVDWMVAVQRTDLEPGADLEDPSSWTWKPSSEVTAEDVVVPNGQGGRRVRPPVPIPDEVEEEENPANPEEPEEVQRVMEVRALRFRPVAQDKLPPASPGMVGAVVLVEQADGFQRLVVCRVNSSGDVGWDDLATGNRLQAGR